MSDDFVSLSFRAYLFQRPKRYGSGSALPLAPRPSYSVPDLRVVVAGRGSGMLSLVLSRTSLLSPGGAPPTTPRRGTVADKYTDQTAFALTRPCWTTGSGCNESFLNCRTAVCSSG